MTRLVLDASAGVDLLLEPPAGIRLQEKVPRSAEWFVPEHYFVEVAGAIRRAELSEAITPARAVRAFADLQSAPLHRALVLPLLAEAWQLRSNVTVPDAVYVVLAHKLGAALVTSDGRLANAPAIDVEIISA